MQVQTQVIQKTTDGHINVKIAAFRDFASQLCAQVVEQLCGEFEREVQVMYKELYVYRGELERVAELLGHQLGREKQLHAMMAQMGELHSTMVERVEGLASHTQSAQNMQNLHQMVEEMNAQHSALLQHQTSGLSQVNSVTSSQVQKAQSLKEESITTEHELRRITEMLSHPLIPGAAPSPTVAAVPSMAAVPGRATPRMSGVPQRMMTSPPASPARVPVIMPIQTGPPVQVQSPQIVMQSVPARPVVQQGAPVVYNVA